MQSPESFRKEGKGSVRLYASRELAESLERAEKESSGEVEPAHLLYAIANQGGKGFDLIRVLSERKFGQILKTLEELSFDKPSFENETQGSTERRFSPALEDLIGRATEYSSRDVVSTDQVILADLTGPDSVLRKGFLRAGIKTPIKEVVDAIVDRIVYEEEGRVEIGSFPLPGESGQELSRVAALEQTDSESQGYLANLIQQAKEGRFEDVVIRPKWATEVLDSLERQSVTVVVTDQEVEALEIVSGTAAQLAKDAGQAFPYKSLVVIDPSYVEERPEETIKEALKAAENGILFISDIARFKDLRLLNSTIASGKVKIITQLTNTQWKKAGQERLFRDSRPIFLDPPSVEETITILTLKKKQLEKRFQGKGLGIEISDEAIKEAAKLADRYFRNLLPPSGAKALLIRAATNLRIRLSGMVDLYDAKVSKDNSIDEEDIRLALKHLTGIEVLEKDAERYLNMEDFLRKKVVGQDEAVGAVSDAIRRAQAGLKDPKRPIGSFIFMGPSGVGKTELSKVLAEFLFDSEEAMVRLDMSEYQEKHQVARMIGAPPGYVGHDEGGQLTEAVRRNPYSIVLLDEIEKAHADVINVLLQVLDEGRLTDGQGRTVDFRNCVIIMTGNVGSKYFQAEAKVGKQKVIDAVEEEIKDAFRPEFLNRVDKTVIFGTLKPEHISKIVDIQIQKVNKQLSEKGISLKLSDEAVKFLCEKGYNPAYGARPLRRAIQTYIETPISKGILTKDYASGDNLVAELSGENIFFRKETN